MPRYFEDLEVGDGFESPGRTLTEADVVSYAAISGEQDCLDFTAGEDGLPPLVPDLLIMPRTRRAARVASAATRIVRRRPGCRRE